MDSFREREEAFENKFAHDAELQFRAEARRSKLLGLWAATLMGKEGLDAQSYAQQVLGADFKRAGHDDVLRKVAHDLGDRADLDAVRAKMDELLAVARAQIMQEID